uniref:Uncharacterized protein n=1 Tax=Anguilla anguilla TaxID=7936 RepID=A0A0E9T824_ANGAN
MHSIQVNRLLIGLCNYTD